MTPVGSRPARKAVVCKAVAGDFKTTIRNVTEKAAVLAATALVAGVSRGAGHSPLGAFMLCHLKRRSVGLYLPAVS